MVDFNTLIEGPTIQYDDDNVAGWYVNNQRVYNKPNGFTDSPTVTTGYTLRFNTSGVFYEYSCTVTVFAPPDLVIPNDVTICSGESVQLSASVTNATPLTEILWTYGGFNYDNGYWLSPRATGAHTVTVTAANTPLCPTVSKDLHITVNFKATLAKGDPSTVTYCIQETINLNDCIDFFVYDTHANNEKHKADDTTGTITWRNASDYSVISDPEHVLLTSLNDTAFFAEVSGIMVFYSNACTPAFQQSPNIPLALVRVPINITANYFSLTYGYDNMCRGDSVYAAFRLLDDHSNPSPCDTIRDLDVLSGHNVVRQIRTSPTEKTLVFAPFTDLYDTIKVKAKGNLVGVEKDFELFLRKPEPPIIQSDHVCKNTDAYFTVIADHCDTIYHIECPTINDVPHISGQREWTMYVPELSNTTPFQCQVTYFSKLQDDTVKNFLVNHTLEVWIDPPELSVSLMHNHSTLPFNHTAQNLCLGDSLLFTFFTPHNCDTITSITWLQNSGTLNYQDPHVRSFTIKPVQEGDNTYRARVYYKRPKEAIILSIEITYTVKVKRRPRLFISPNPPDTLKYCYPDDAPLNLNLPNPSAAIIDYNFVASGPDTVRFLVPNGSHVDTLSSFKPPVTGNYVVEANYKYLCSEMDTTLARGEVRIVVNSKTEDGATFIVTPPSEGFCISEGITIRSANKEGSSLAWEHNGIAVTSFPYFPPGGTGTHTFTTYIYNACYPSGSPKRYDIDVRVAPIPAVEAMPDITVCRGDSVTLKVAPGSFVGDTLIWWTLSGTTTKDTVEVYATTTFKATARNVCGDISDEVTVFCMADAAVHLMPDTAACLHDEIRLRVIQKEGDIIWRSSHFNLIGTGDNFTIRVDGNETYTAVAFNQCGRDSAYLRVTALYLPSVTVKNDTSICHGAFLDFSDCIIGNALGILQWRPGQGAILTEPGRYITDPDIYIATVSTEKCGSDSDTTYVNVYPPLLLLPDNSNLPRYNNQDLYDVSFQTLQAAPALSYSISGTLPAGLIIINGRISGKPVLGPYDYNTHHLQVSVTDGHQCQTSREYILAPEWKAATVLLPVGDAENAVFLPGYNLEVYNRNGLLLHKGMGWDGMWNNTFVPPGTYFYSVKILIDDRLEDRMGYVVVMYY
ncbi:MAG: gliding motility-associated C-terminal domain-containing protein [Prevotellaceae bacterium]|jgi:hypothetical protein|nr:gliding motility-associated C-terminal domain-containing protein [Prevotellaceae bacterium]